MLHDDEGTQPPRLLSTIGLPSTAIFAAYLVVGMSLPVLPLYLHDVLGVGGFVVGVVIGTQSLASVLTRPFAGHIADSRGVWLAVVGGLAAAAASGLFYLTAGLLDKWPSLVAMVLGRVALGLSESLVMTGALSMGITLAGPRHTGKMMVWSGISLYGAVGIGAPFGAALYHLLGFAGFSVTCAAIPVAALLLPFASPQVAHGERMSFFRVIGRVWELGITLSLSVIGFGALGTFITLYFQENGWNGAPLALTLFGAAYIATRLLFGHLPDKIGGTPVALVSLAGEILGLTVLWLAPGPVAAYAGAALTGLGYSLIFPALGIEAARRGPPSSRGALMGAYVAFFDLGLAVAGPGIGLLTNSHGYRIAYLIGALTAAAALLLFGGITIAQRRIAGSGQA